MKNNNFYKNPQRSKYLNIQNPETTICAFDTVSIFVIMNTIIRYTRKIPIWKYALGLAAIAVSILGIFSLNIYGLVPLVFGFMMLKTEGSEIDLTSKQYRMVTSIMGVTLGSWESLQKAEYISVFSTSETITWRYITAETTNAFPIIDLNIFFENNKKVTVYKTKTLKDAYDVALHIADTLDIDILDATEANNYKWVDKEILRKKGEIKYTN